MAVTLYLRIPTKQRLEWRRKGWKFVRRLWPWPRRDSEQCLVKKVVRS
ncbi:MAG: hypothetical protein M1377_05065 [Deltaproteobacteria bacterium]|nr:hypothetical protein [Deltaproteobacteria bacterium]